MRVNLAQLLKEVTAKKAAEAKVAQNKISGVEETILKPKGTAGAKDFQLIVEMKLQDDRNKYKAIQVRYVHQNFYVAPRLPPQTRRPQLEFTRPYILIITLTITLSIQGCVRDLVHTAKLDLGVPYSKQPAEDLGRLFRVVSQ